MTPKLFDLLCSSAKTYDMKMFAKGIVAKVLPKLPLPSKFMDRVYNVLLSRGAFFGSFFYLHIPFFLSL